MKVGNHIIEVSRPDKVLFPKINVTKADLVDYYKNIADVMLPHLKGRPIVMHRFPDGIKGKGFFHKDAPDYFPGWIRTLSVHKEGGTVRHVMCDNAATLAFLADQACITPHVWLSKQDKLDHPDRLIFDLDPPDNDFKTVRFAADKLRHLIGEEMGLSVFLTTTGSRGVHVVVPLNRKGDFASVRDFGRDVTELLSKRFPKRLTQEVRKNKRRGRLFLDIARNAYAQTTVAPYAVRAKPGAPVATPLEWDELSDKQPQSYNIRNIFRRLSQKADPWKDINVHSHSLTSAKKILKKMLKDL